MTLLLSPNPASTRVSVSYELQEGVDYHVCSVVVSNLAGQQVVSSKLSSGNGKETLSLLDLPAGTYVVSITNGGTVLGSQRLIKGK